MRASSRLSPGATYFQSLCRIVFGFLFWCHGAQLILGMFGGQKQPMVSLMGLGGILELIGGALILVGLFTRPTAFVLSGAMAFAFFHVHYSRKAPLPIQNDGELAVLYCFYFLSLTFAGPGLLSADTLIRKKG